MPAMDGPLAPVMLFLMLGSVLFDFFFGFEFFAEFGIFGFAAFAFAFVFAFFVGEGFFFTVARIGFFVSFAGHGGEVAGKGGHAEGMGRCGRGHQREQQQDEQEGEVAHRPFIGAAAGGL